MNEERGFTLVELLIYSVLSVIVLLIVGGFLINSLSAERTVRDLTTASSSGQLVAQSISSGVRDASALMVTAPSAGTELLVVRTMGTADVPDWTCQAWYYGAGEIRTRTSSGAIPIPDATTVTDWTLIGEWIQPASSDPVFTLIGNRVDLNLEVTTGDGQPVLISTSAVSRQPIPATGVISAPCF